MIERYTLPEMGKIWEEEFKYSTWLQIEILACEARANLNEIPLEDVNVIKSKANSSKPFCVSTPEVLRQCTQGNRQ